MIGVVPFIAIYWFYRVHCRVMDDIYKRTVGHLTDRELIELDIKLNPGKEILYRQALLNDDKK